MSPACTRRLHSLSKWSFISSMFRIGRFQAASTERSARCRSDQIQVLSGGLLMIGIGASCISVARRVSSDVWVVAGPSSSSSASQRSRTASALGRSGSERSVNWIPVVRPPLVTQVGIMAPSFGCCLYPMGRCCSTLLPSRSGVFRTTSCDVPVTRSFRIRSVPDEVRQSHSLSRDATELSSHMSDGDQHWIAYYIWGDRGRRPP